MIKIISHMIQYNIISKCTVSIKIILINILMLATQMVNNNDFRNKNKYKL